MYVYAGTHGRARVYAAAVDQATEAQIRVFLDHPAFAGDCIAVMPDCHLGVGAVIGLTMPLGDLVIPNVIGVDIGCGVESWRVGAGHVDFAAFDVHVRRTVPSGRARHDRPVVKEEEGWYDRAFARLVGKLADKVGLAGDAAVNSLGTLGGGNHFLELDRAADGAIWLTIHSGSRHFGLSIATHHQKLAKAWCRKHGVSTPSGLEYLPRAEGGEDYLADMRAAQRYAAVNRREMARRLLGGFFSVDLDRVPHVASVHNYIDFEDGVIRKGAIAARLDQPVVIPLNMRDGVVLGAGKGNVEWNRSAPHGAGRALSRTQAKATLDVKAYGRDMDGIWSSCVGRGTLDEAPQAYKPAAEILAALAEAVTVREVWRPVYNYKAAE